MLDEATAEIRRIKADYERMLEVIGRSYWREDGRPILNDELAQKIRAQAFEEAADAIKHLSHEDGLGMGSLRMEAAIRGLAAK